MHFVKTTIPDSYLINLEPKKDDRGAFCRLFCSDFFKQHGIEQNSFVQVNLSENLHQHTLRGMHFQLKPHEEAKIVYCLKGKVVDVILDLRPSSPTFTEHFKVELSEEVPQALYIPKGCAHGFLTLKDHTQLLYLMSDFYKSGSQSGYRYDDPAFNIKWPFTPKVVAEKDLKYPFFSESNK